LHEEIIALLKKGLSLEEIEMQYNL